MDELKTFLYSNLPHGFCIPQEYITFVSRFDDGQDPNKSTVLGALHENTFIQITLKVYLEGEAVGKKNDASLIDKVDQMLLSIVY